MKKKGVTLSALLVYVVLFYLFTMTATMISSNINNKIFKDRAKVYNYKNSEKTMAYLIESTRNSSSVDVISNKLVFANNDEYKIVNNTVYKNDKVILRDVEKFEYSTADISKYKQQVSINIVFKKYTQKLEKNFNFVVGGNS
ncbi:MAG: hypothetical protein RR922_05345 [Clostridia bacterium]